MKFLLTIVLFVAMNAPAFCQRDSGIFLTTQCAKRSEKQTVMLSNKQVCLAANPIILPADFNSLTDVQVIGDKIWFDLTLSANAIQKLMQLSSSLPNSTFALVVDQDVFYTFPASDIQVGRTFRFQATGKDKSTFADMQRRLKALIDSRG